MSKTDRLAMTLREIVGSFDLKYQWSGSPDDKQWYWRLETWSDSYHGENIDDLLKRAINHAQI